MFFKYYWKALVWAFFILILSILPVYDIPEVKIKHLDKMVHFFMYAVLCFFSINGLIKQSFFPSLRCFCCSFSFVYCAIYGGIIEWVQQHFIIGRSGDWIDFVFNITGALVVSVFLAIKYKSL